MIQYEKYIYYTFSYRLLYHSGDCQSSLGIMVLESWLLEFVSPVALKLHLFISFAHLEYLCALLDLIYYSVLCFIFGNI